MVKQIDLSRVDLNLLVLFEVVFAERHVGRAAYRLHLSRSAVSHGVARLRRLLNDPVFVCTPKGVVPTDRAVELAGSCEAPLPLTGFRLNAVAPRAAMMDAGLAWLFDVLVGATPAR